MSLVKSEVKIETVNDIGNRLDDMKEANEKDLYRLEGASKAFQTMGQAIDALFKIVDQEMDEGKFDLEMAEHVKRFVKRAQQMSINLGMQAENNRFMQLGRIQAMEAAVGVAKKIREDEMGKIATLAAAIEANKAKAKNGEAAVDPDDVGRPAGGRMSIKERRLAEDAAEAAEAEKTNGHAVAQSDVASTPATEAEVPEAPAEAPEAKPAKKPQSKGRWAKGKRA